VLKFFHPGGTLLGGDRAVPGTCGKELGFRHGAFIRWTQVINKPRWLQEVQINMSDKDSNIPPGLQGAFNQVLKEVQNALKNLESTITNATQPQGQPIEEEPAEKPQPKKPRTEYNGQKWEYKVVYVNFRGQISSEGDQVIIGRGERRSSFVRAYVDELGQDGWELAGVSPLGETENSYFVFKRPSTGEKPATSTNGATATKVEVEEIKEDGVVNM
jgi:hypothetical protein